MIDVIEYLDKIMVEIFSYQNENEKRRQAKKFVRLQITVALLAWKTCLLRFFSKIRMKNVRFLVENIEIQSIYDLEISTKNLENRNPEKQPREKHRSVMGYKRFSSFWIAKQIGYIQIVICILASILNIMTLKRNNFRRKTETDNVLLCAQFRS